MYVIEVKFIRSCRACVVFLELHKDLISTVMLSSMPPASVLATVGLRREEKTMAQTVELQGTEWQMPQEEQMNCCRALENGKCLLWNYFKMVDWAYNTDSGSPNRPLKKYRDILFVKSSVKIKFKIIEIIEKDWIIFFLWLLQARFPVCPVVKSLYTVSYSASALDDLKTFPSLPESKL